MNGGGAVSGPRNSLPYFCRPLPPVARRWAGVYSQVTEPGALYLRAPVATGVEVVTGPGGRGMTLAPAIAAESFA